MERTRIPGAELQWTPAKRGAEKHYFGANEFNWADLPDCLSRGPPCLSRTDVSPEHQAKSEIP